MTSRRASFLAAAALAFGTGFWSLTALASDLVNSLTSQLGVSQEQAMGGSGAIFDYAKNELSADDFSLVADAVPDMDSLLAAAPKSGDGLTGALSSGLPSVGGSSDSLGSLAALAGPFGDLGLSPDMVSKFVPVVLDYVQSSGGQAAMEALKGALL